MLNKVHQEGETSQHMPEDQDQSFDAVTNKYINLDSVKFVLFTTLESSSNHRWTKIMFKIDTGTLQSHSIQDIQKCI